MGSTVRSLVKYEVEPNQITNVVVYGDCIGFCRVSKLVPGIMLCLSYVALKWRTSIPFDYVVRGLDPVV